MQITGTIPMLLPLAQVVLCDCTPGWAGEFCEVNFDACMGSPCFMGVLCIDEDPPSLNSTCGDCPEGLEGDGRTCKGENPECPPRDLLGPVKAGEKDEEWGLDAQTNSISMSSSLFL